MANYTLCIENALDGEQMAKTELFHGKYDITMYYYEAGKWQKSIETAIIGRNKSIKEHIKSLINSEKSLKALRSILHAESDYPHVVISFDNYSYRISNRYIKEPFSYDNYPDYHCFKMVVWFNKKKKVK